VDYLLLPKAREDIEDAWRYTADTWSEQQADLYVDGLVRAFELIANLPEIGREHTEFEPAVRIHVHAGHLIVYRSDDNCLWVLRVLGGRRDWRAILGAQEP